MPVRFVYYSTRPTERALTTLMTLHQRLVVRAAALLILLVPAFLCAQEEAVMRLRLAQQFEQAGDFERAAAIYESLAAAEPTNYVYFDGLRRVYTQLKEYDKAISLVQRRLVLQRDDPVLLTSLGALQHQAGREDVADSVWNAVVKLNPMNPALYRVVASQMIELRLYEQAISVYQRARQQTGIHDVFTEELATLYGALQQYEAATREYVMLVKRNPMQLPLAQSKIAALTTTPEAARIAFDVVRSAVEEDARNPSLRIMLASLAMDARQYDIALREVRLVDDLKNAQGGELYAFAQRALQDGAYEAADEAYNDIIERHPRVALVPYAKLGRIRTREERLSSADSGDALTLDERLVTSRTAVHWPVQESEGGWAEVIGLYEALANEYSPSTIAAQSQFRIGTIASEKLFDLDRALSAFGIVGGMREAGDLMFHARLQSARVLTAQNRLVQARSAYVPLRTVSLALVRDAAIFELAELDYFEGLFDTATVVFKVLGEQVRGDLANDALKYLYFIRENLSSAPAALRAFANADLLVRQRKYSEALECFHDLRKAYPAALLQDIALLRVGELSLAVGRTDSALVAFRFLADSMQTSIVRDRALLLSAQLQERVRKDRTKALATYEELLERFPTSIYAQQSRQRIRILRGDSP